MLLNEVTVSEMWVTCMLHNWCTDVYAQYGPWFSLRITAWSSFISPSPSPLPFLPPPHFPQLLNSIQTSSLGGRTPPLLFVLHSSGGCCICLRLRSQAHPSSLNGWRWLAWLRWWFLSPLPFLYNQCCSCSCLVCCYQCELCQLHLELVLGPDACSRSSWA